MAILIEEHQAFNWKALVIFIIALTIVGGAIYYLFFAPVPGIEIIAPASVRSTTELSNVELDLGVSTDLIRDFRRYTGQPSVGQIGRENPFIKY